MGPFRRRAALLVLALVAAGCAELLPKAHTEVTSPWRSFDEARQAIESIVPEKTTRGELRALGIDPYDSTNVQLLSFSDILLRFPMSGGGASQRLDAGLRECLESGKSCTGYSVSVKDVKRDRVGSFWLDTLGFKRQVETTGWSFNALILMVNERVVYTLYGGQPNLREYEVQRQPLGPAQNFGEAIPGALR